MYLGLFVLLLLLTGIVMLTRISSLQISMVKVSGNSFVPTEEIQNKTDEVLGSHYLFFIPKRNVFLFPKHELADKLKENPAVIDVSINKDLFDTLSIVVTEQEKEAIYCDSFEKTECFYINNEGYLYSKVGQDHPLDQEIIVYLEGERKKVREMVLEPDLYQDVISFIKSSARYGIPVVSAHVKSDGIIEFTTQSSARLITSRYDDFEKDFSNFIALFEKEILIREQLGQIDYVDLRFGNKVFYKNKAP
jgi:cell division septal protein FtsQ